MLIDVRLFAMLRERAGSGTVTIEVPDSATVRDAKEAVARAHGLGDLMDRTPVVMAVNREYADEDAPLAEGDELALIPPVSGGDGAAGADANTSPAVSGGSTGVTHARIVEEPLSLERLAGLVGRPAAGAIVTFQGTTRDVQQLEYEAYREMAEERIAAIVAEAVERHGLEAAAAEHRVGVVPLGEASVAVAAAAAHREEAFAGAREIIDRIKAEAPIWKKEVEGGGGRWVEGAPPRGDGRAG
jgi:molybdopterin synthase catalytic subunit